MLTLAGCCFIIFPWFVSSEVVLPQVRQKLINTKKRMEDILSGQRSAEDEDCEWYDKPDDLARPLLACYR